MKKVRLTAALILLATALCGCTGLFTKSDTETRFLLNTAVTITVYGRDSKQAVDDGFALCSRLERLFSRTIESSDTARINDADGEWVEISKETADVLKEALYYCELSDGLFDVTIGAVSSLWDFNSDEKRVPGQGEIEAALTHVGYGGLKLDESDPTRPRASLSQGAALDLGGIAKGYIGDRIKELFSQYNIDAAIINLGGNVVLYGDRPTGGPLWTVGLRDPFSPHGEVIASVEVAGGMNVVSSGSYERYFEKDGIIYHHILDTKTGFPVTSDIAGVSIICKSGAMADALSTICFVLGREGALGLIEKIDEAECLIVSSDGQIYTSSNMGSKIKYKIIS